MIHSLAILKYKLLCNIILDIVFGFFFSIAAICSNCTDREVCVAPEECVCSAGWTGENCTEGSRC